MSSTSKLMPNLDERSTKMLNLTVLQRIDPSIEEILITAAHVTLYEFNVDLNQWSRKEVEGSFFVVKSIQYILSQIDNCIQYGEDADVKVKDFDPEEDD